MQERLIKNKTLLTAIEPAISCTSLEVSFQLDGDPDDHDHDGGGDDDGDNNVISCI